MSVDLNNMSKEELKKLIREAEKALKTIETRRLTQAKKAAESAAKEYGFSLDELLGSAPAKGKKGSKGVAQYQNPESPDQTWTGKGRKPNWVIEALASGKTMEDLKI